MFLLDTNVISQLRRAKPHGAVVAWLNAQQSAALFVSAMTITELQQGIELTRNQDAPRAERLEHWLVYELLPNAQVLAMDANVARTWAKLMHKRSNTLFEDALIAATAIAHDLIVVTRNVRDFKSLGVKCFDPFTYKPGRK
jgi:toxin FitB